MDTIKSTFDSFFKKQWFIESKVDDIKKYYNFNESQALGSGSFG